MRIFIGCTLLAIAAVGLVANLVGAEHTANPAGNCDRMQADARWDCVINSGDQLIISQHFGNTANTYTPIASNTPTNTPTPTNTGTPTNTPTVTPTPSGYTIEDLLDDTTAAHEGAICSYLSGYSWYSNGRVNSVEPPAGVTAFKAWGTAQWAACGDDSPGGNWEIRNLRVLYLGGDLEWHQYSGPNPFNWCARVEANTQDYLNPDECTGATNGWVMVGGENALHWATAQQALASTTYCHIVTYESRATNGAQIMANTGFDWYSGTEVYEGDSWFGSYQLLTADWQIIGGTSCDIDTLQVFPPPL